MQNSRNPAEISFQEDHPILPGAVESRADGLYSTVQVEGKAITLTTLL